MKRAALILILLLMPLAAFAQGGSEAKYYTLDPSPLGAGFVTVTADAYALSGGELEKDAYGYEGFAARMDEKATLTIPVTVEKAGWYEIVLDYYLPKASVNDLFISLAINGESPFYECRNIPLYAVWQDESGDYPQDSYGNQLSKSPERVYVWQTATLNSKTYELAQGLLFPFEAGENTITLTTGALPCLIGSLTVRERTTAPTYEEYRASLSPLETPASATVIEGESYSAKNHSYSRAVYLANSSCVPYEAGVQLVNILANGGWYWPGEGVTYTFTVPSDGDYRLTLKCCQPIKDFPVFKHILIDGETPFSELYAYSFDHTGEDTFKNCDISVGGESALIRLTAGEHTLTLMSTAEKTYTYYDRLTAVMNDMTQVALEIRMISGGSTDEYRDWNIEEYLPGLGERIQAQADELQEIYDALRAFTEGEPSDLSPIRVAASRLRYFAGEPDKLVNSLSIYSEGSSSYAGSIATYLSEMLWQDMCIDRAYFLSGDERAPEAMLNFLESAAMSVKTFILSFAKSSNASQQQAEEGVLNIWMGRNIAYVQQVRLFIDKYFTPKTGIKVQISAMPDESKLLLSVSSGLGPDVVLSGSNYRPFDFALRGALLNLRQFEDFGEYIKAFNSETLVPFCINDACYGLPETLSFQLLFYRKDVLEKLVLSVPNTWDDVIEMLPTLERYGMDFGTQLAAAGSSKHFGVTTPFIQQFNGKIYADDGASVALGDPNTIKAFELMTDLYTKYSLPQTVASFYASFRYGTMPVGMSDSNTYILLREAAPELAEQWGVAPCVGVRDEETGEVLRYQMATSTSCFILGDTKMPDESWEFLKWWMSEETQTDFAQSVRLVYGADFVWNSANLAAFNAGSGYDEETLAVVEEQFKYIKEIPRNPAYFSVERELSNAWNKVVLQGQPVRTAIDYAITQCNRVVVKKLKEFNFMDEDGNLVTAFRPVDGDVIDTWKEAAK